MASLLWTKQQQQTSKFNSRAPSSMFNSNNLSPRQVANKAYSLAIKKLDRDDKRSRPKYNVRERLLLCNTLSKAEQFLQKRTARTNRRVMAFEEEEDMISPSNDIMTNTTSSLSSSSSSSSSSSLAAAAASSSSLTDTSSLPSSDSSSFPLLSSPSISSHHQHHQYHHVEHHSPLCHIEETDDDDDDEPLDQHHLPSPDNEQHAHQHMTMDMALASKSLSLGNAFVIPQDDEDFLQYPSSFLIPSNQNTLASDCRPLGSQQTAHFSPIASII